MSMGSRLGAVVLLAAVAAAGAGAAQPTPRSVLYTAQGDPRMCPSPLCGGYWVALANGARTRCGDGTRQARCYVARAVDRNRRALSSLPAGALLRGAIEQGQPFAERRLDQLVVRA